MIPSFKLCSSQFSWYNVLTETTVIKCKGRTPENFMMLSAFFFVCCSVVRVFLSLVMCYTQKEMMFLQRRRNPFQGKPWGTMRNLDEATLLTNFGCFSRGSDLSLYSYVATERVIVRIKAVKCSSSVGLPAHLSWPSVCIKHSLITLDSICNTGVHCLTVWLSLWPVSDKKTRWNTITGGPIGPSDDRSPP